LVCLVLIDIAILVCHINITLAVLFGLVLVGLIDIAFINLIICIFSFIFRALFVLRNCQFLFKLSDL
jgi:hypothetical protein